MPSTMMRARVISMRQTQAEEGENEVAEGHDELPAGKPLQDQLPMDDATSKKTYYNIKGESTAQSSEPHAPVPAVSAAPATQPSIARLRRYSQGGGPAVQGSIAPFQDTQRIWPTRIKATCEVYGMSGNSPLLDRLRGNPYGCSLCRKNIDAQSKSRGTYWAKDLTAIVAHYTSVHFPDGVVINACS
eukprot:1268680-Amphidinium_carterae.1